MSWFRERPDRMDLMCWLAVRADHGGAFYKRMLDHLVQHGSLTAAQETAVRHAHRRAVRDAVRQDPSRNQRPARGQRRGNAASRPGTAMAEAEARG